MSDVGYVGVTNQCIPIGHISLSVQHIITQCSNKGKPCLKTTLFVNCAFAAELMCFDIESGSSRYTYLCLKVRSSTVYLNVLNLGIDEIRGGLIPAPVLKQIFF